MFIPSLFSLSTTPQINLGAENKFEYEAATLSYIPENTLQFGMSRFLSAFVMYHKLYSQTSLKLGLAVRFKG